MKSWDFSIASHWLQDKLQLKSNLLREFVVFYWVKIRCIFVKNNYGIEAIINILLIIIVYITQKCKNDYITLRSNTIVRIENWS